MTSSAKWPLLLLLTATSSMAASPDSRIAAMERSLSPLVTIRGETPRAAPLEQRMDELKVPAVSLAVISGGRVEWAKAYGYADKETGVKATPGTLFQAGSISKPVAALAVLKLVEDGALSLDTDVNEKLKSWRLPDNEFTARHKVTLRTILNHTAGTTVWGFPGYERDSKVPSIVDVLEGRGNTEAIRVWITPGERWRYSGGGYTILQLMLTDVTGRPFPDLLEHLVLEPLGMTNSTYGQPLPDKWQPRSASGYMSDGAKVPGSWHVYPEMAAAGLWTTASDLAKFLLEVQRSRHGKGRILSAKMAGEMLAPGMNNHGLGPVISADGKRFGHGGADAGFQADATAFLDGDSGVVIMTNSDNGGRLAQELELTLGRIYGWEGLTPVQKSVLKLSPAALQRFAGTYQFTDGRGSIVVRAGDDVLIVSNAGQPDVELSPESETKFFDRDSGFPVEFVTEGASMTAIVRGNARATRQSQ
jgi:CubicO group peptidase (beta-lactamase class C family)